MQQSLQTALYQQNYVAFWVPKGGGSTLKPPLNAPLNGGLVSRLTGSNGGMKWEHGMMEQGFRGRKKKIFFIGSEWVKN